MIAVQQESVIFDSKYRNSRRGFTLIELIVIIAIVGLISAMVLTFVKTSRMKARDTKRINDLHQIRLALEMYFSEYGKYPRSPGTSVWVSSADANKTNWLALEAELSPYIKKLPINPINYGTTPYNNTNPQHYSYMYGWRVGYGSCLPPYMGLCDTSGHAYDLIARLEDPNNQYRCAVKKYKIHTFSVDRQWCGTWSGQKIADH